MGTLARVRAKLFMAGLVSNTAGGKGANGHGWALGVDQNGFAFAFRRADKIHQQQAWVSFALATLVVQMQKVQALSSA